MSPYIAAELAIMKIANLIEDGKPIPDDIAIVKYVSAAQERIRIKKLIDKDKECLTEKLFALLSA